MKKNVKLYKGDCLEVMKKMSDKSVDFILTDPPYGTTACKWDSVIPFAPMWEQINRIIKDRGAVALFGSEPFSSALRMSNIKNYKYDWIWDKKSAGNILVAKYQPLKRHEIISIFNAKNYYPIFTEGRDRTGEAPRKKKSDLFSGLKSGQFQHGRNKKGNQRYPFSILDFSTQSSECANSKRVHPTQKPIALLEYFIKTYTLEGETVLDFTMGSGSTGVACINTGRNFIGIEKDEKYFEIAKNRIEQAAK